MLVFVVLGQIAAAGLVSKGVFDKSSPSPRSAAVAEEHTGVVRSGGGNKNKSKIASNTNAPIPAIRSAIRNGANVVDLRRADNLLWAPTKNLADAKGAPKHLFLVCVACWRPARSRRPNARRALAGSTLRLPHREPPGR